MIDVQLLIHDTFCYEKGPQGPLDPISDLSLVCFFRFHAVDILKFCMHYGYWALNFIMAGSMTHYLRLEYTAIKNSGFSTCAFPPHPLKRAIPK